MNRRDLNKTASEAKKLEDKYGLDEGIPVEEYLASVRTPAYIDFSNEVDAVYNDFVKRGVDEDAAWDAAMRKVRETKKQNDELSDLLPQNRVAEQQGDYDLGREGTDFRSPK